MSANNHLAGPLAQPRRLPTMTKYRRATLDLIVTSGATRESPMTVHGARFRAAMWLFDQGLVELVGCAFYVNAY